MEASTSTLDSSGSLASKIGHQTLWPELRELCRFDPGMVLEVGAGGARNRERDFFAVRVKCWITLDINRGAAADVAASVLALPFRAESFDTVVCNVLSWAVLARRP